ncbi:MAG: DsbA family protein [Thermoplasmatota archaeon]
MSKIQLVHSTSPVCHWSWGYEAVLNRIERVYGDQVEYVVAQAIPYTDRKQWLEDYDMSDKEAIDFVRETLAYGGLPARVPASFHDMPASALPAALAVKGAGLAHDEHAERRLTRALMFAALVEGQDVADDKILSQVIEAQGLDLKRILAVVESEGAMKALEEDGARAGHGANFYSLIVRNEDDDPTSVVLERAYDPMRVEHAIDYLSGGKLQKKDVPVSGLLAYVKENRAVSAPEVARVFALPGAKAKAELDALEKSGRLAEFGVKGVDGSFWKVA